MRRRIIENPSSFSGRDTAIKIRETFQDKPFEKEETFSWDWPRSLTCIGVGYAVMYRSDKWHARREYESYKHLCEGKVPWKVYASPSFECSGAEIVGEKRDVSPGDMPKTFAELANFLGLQARLYEEHGSRLVLPTGDNSLLEIQLARAKLGAGKTRAGHVFLCVYIPDEGPKLFIFGEELDVLKDGIVG